MLGIGEELAAEAFASWTWERAEVTGEHPDADLVTATYALGELEAAVARDVATQAWHATTGCLLIVEPGTPAGFHLVRQLRAHLIEQGARLLAPCPNEGDCPISGTDWCHFAARLGRSALHRSLKGGDRSFEDEKFSYVAFTRHEAAPALGRVVRRPFHRRRFVQLSVCRNGEIQRLGLGQSHPGYRVASKLAWGDAVPAEVLAAEVLAAEVLGGRDAGRSTR
jgi:ribosomal protein RSM22 (predicted rRNA methylase)